MATSAKTVRVSDDAGANWRTLPGSSGELSNEAGSIEDTVFGQLYQSNSSGLVNWSVNASAYYKGYVGYMAKIKKTGTSTVMTTEAMTQQGASKTYKITSSAKEVWDPVGPFNVFDGGVNKNAEVLSFNYLFGMVTFKASYTPTGAITVTGKYFPMVALGKAQSYTLTQTSEAIDKSDFDTVQANGGYRTFTTGLKTVSLELSGFYAVSNAFRAALNAHTVFLLEIDPGGDGKSVARGFFKAVNEGQSGDVGALEEETATFALYVPSTDYIPFDWEHESDTTLNIGVRICLSAFLQGTEIMTQYLHDGTNGVAGTAVVTEMSLAGGLDNMNEFTVALQGSGAQTPVGTG